MHELTANYLARLGLEPEPPSAGALIRIHRAQLERVPYETTWIHLGEQWNVDPTESLERVAGRSRGGYCFHLNGALSLMLTDLGYDVSLHVGGVHGDQPSPTDLTNHLVLLVHGLATDANPGGDWYVDAGLGDALHEPLPLLAGTYVQGPMTFVLTETPGGVGDWHFTHDPSGSFAGMSFGLRTASMAEFADRHRFLSTSPESSFMRAVTAQRRDPDAVIAVRALTLTIDDEQGRSKTVFDDRRDWFELLADEFSLTLDGVDREARDRLWAHAQSSHAAHLAEGQATNTDATSESIAESSTGSPATNAR